MLKVKVTELRGSGNTLDLPWGKISFEANESKTADFQDMNTLNEHLRPLVAEGVFGWVLLPESEGY